MNWFQNACLVVGEFCKETAIPFLTACVLIRLYIYLGNKNKSYARGIRFFDTFVTNLAKQFEDVNTADIINFKKNKENEN